MTDDTRDRLSSRLQALADPTRLRLLELTHAAEPTATECIAALGLSQPRVARHLKILVEAGFLRSRREGRFVVYSHATEEVTSTLIHAVLRNLASPPAAHPSVESPSRLSRGAGRDVTLEAPRPTPGEPGPRGRDADDDPPPEAGGRKPMEDFLL